MCMKEKTLFQTVEMVTMTKIDRWDMVGWNSTAHWMDSLASNGMSPINRRHLRPNQSPSKICTRPGIYARTICCNFESISFWPFATPLTMFHFPPYAQYRHSSHFSHRTNKIQHTYPARVFTRATHSPIHAHVQTNFEWRFFYGEWDPEESKKDVMSSAPAIHPSR